MKHYQNGSWLEKKDRWNCIARQRSAHQVFGSRYDGVNYTVDTEVWLRLHICARSGRARHLSAVSLVHEACNYNSSSILSEGAEVLMVMCLALTFKALHVRNHRQFPFLEALGWAEAEDHAFRRGEATDRGSRPAPPAMQPLARTTGSTQPGEAYRHVSRSFSEYCQ